MNISVEEIKKYNQTLKEHKEKSAKVEAELAINNNELNRLCSELSKELGVTVTPENAEQIYSEYVNKLRSTLEAGNSILERVKKEGERIEAMESDSLKGVLEKVKGGVVNGNSEMVPESILRGVEEDEAGGGTFTLDDLENSLDNGLDKELGGDFKLPPLNANFSL